MLLFKNHLITFYSVARSCRALKLIFESQRKPLYDGVYTIQPAEGYRTKTYCDFNRDGGGWTLIVTSHTNTWTAENVLLRNENSPDLRKDYSILKFADKIKFSYLSSSPTFEYRLEAEQLGIELMYYFNCLYHFFRLQYFRKLLK